MKSSNYLINTRKEVPAGTEAMSHQWMLRAGFVASAGPSGFFHWLPLGLRVLKKLSKLTARTMEDVGGMEIQLPMLQDAGLWETSNRLQAYGSELWRLQDRHNKAYVLGPTHEEIVVTLAKQQLRKSTQFPCLLFQIQPKFRDEMRPRGGLLRSREFWMKDAYSFHLTQQSLQVTYQLMRSAYRSLFKQVGLQVLEVTADNGSMGGSHSHEFHAILPVGEDAIAVNENGTYACSLASAPVVQRTRRRPSERAEQSKPCALQIVYLKRAQPTQPYLAILLRQEDRINPTKIARLLKEPETDLVWADSSEVQAWLTAQGASSFLPPSMPRWIDIDAYAAPRVSLPRLSLETASESTDLQWGTSVLPGEIIEDLRYVVSGDPSPDGNGDLKIVRGLEVGHLFQLNDHYSKAFSFGMTQKQGGETWIEMGCYGIGLSRVMAALVEQYGTHATMRWPTPVAPFTVALVGLNARRQLDVYAAIEAIYLSLRQAGVDVLWEDRPERLGFLLTEIELMGIPHVLVLGAQSLSQGMIEYLGSDPGLHPERIKQSWPIKDALTELLKVLDQANAHYTADFTGDA